jgi:hypothetical protein
MTDTARRSRPRLRLLRNEHQSPASHEPRAAGAAQTASVGLNDSEHTPVLIAGADSSARTKMLQQLRGLLPDGTPFVEAHETWEVIAQASESSMVVLTGDLYDLSARGLMRVLSRRHPLLPVIALGGRTDGAGAPELGAASL